MAISILHTKLSLNNSQADKLSRYSLHQLQMCKKDIQEDMVRMYYSELKNTSRSKLYR